jgi:endogenous inhibitor of DNA gyrase (YacG/DUF329 family)
MSNLSAPGSTRRGVCPICGKPTAEQFKPFCSRRCADIDLNRWLSGAYAVPAIEAEGESEIEPTDDESPRRRE